MAQIPAQTPAQTPALDDPPRWLQPTRRSDLRVTWHHEDELVVISLWRDDTCVATAPLSILEAASLTSFLVHHMGAAAASAQDAGHP
jgi:hypothetical protein